MCLSLMMGRFGVTVFSLVLGILLDFACTAAICLLSGTVLGEFRDYSIMLFALYLLFSTMPYTQLLVGLYVNLLYLHSWTTLKQSTTRSQMYVQRNILVLSCNQCSSGYAISINVNLMFIEPCIIVITEE